MTVDPACYSGNGLTFTASDYGSPAHSFDWSIYALKDTTKASGFTLGDLKIDMLAPDKFTVPDSLIAKYPRLLITVATSCGGQPLHSIYYSFVKTSTSANCSIWAAQK
ncbi:hypothetical protein GCM10028805_58000 [Spirosoma harenae]